MSRQGMTIAKQYASELPAFANLAEAEKMLFQLRDKGLSQLLNTPDLGEKLDCSPPSLKTLEQWFFLKDQPVFLASGFSTSIAMGFYFGEVCCLHANFSWVVAEFAFEKGRYEIGIKRSILSIMLSKGRLPSSTANKRMQSLWREFQRYAS